MIKTIEPEALVVYHFSKDIYSTLLLIAQSAMKSSADVSLVHPGFLGFGCHRPP